MTVQVPLPQDISNVVPGYGNKTTNNLRLWSAKPTREFDLEKFNSGDYESSVREQQRAETISAVLYPNDNIDVGKGTHTLFS